MGLLLPFLQLLLLQSPRPSPRLKLIPTCTEDMVGMDWDTLAMEDTMDMVLDTAIMESVRLKLLLSHTFMVDTMDMVLATVGTMDMVLDMPATMDIPMVDIPILDKLFPLI